MGWYRAVAGGLGMMMVAGAAAAEHPGAGGLVVPSPVVAEHQSLMAELDEALKAGGKTGDAAAQLKRVLLPHFMREEEIALPQLGALRPCVENRMTDEMEKSARLLSATLKRELPAMLKEHQAIAAAVRLLHGAAVGEGKDRAARFAEELAEHAKTEEEILYPAAVLVGTCRRAG